MNTMNETAELILCRTTIGWLGEACRFPQR